MSDISDFILYFKPKNWRTIAPKRKNGGRILVDALFLIEPKCEEFQDIQRDLSKSIKYMQEIEFLERVQNIHHYGQFLTRGQILVLDRDNNETVSLYQVRRYVAVPKSKKDLALKHNLDHRRLEMPKLEFCSHLEEPIDLKENHIYVVKIITENPRQRVVIPDYFQDYYIEYIAALK